MLSVPGVRRGGPIYRPPRLWRAVEILDDGGKGGFKGRCEIRDGSKEELRGRVTEVVDMELEFGSGELGAVGS